MEIYVTRYFNFIAETRMEHVYILIQLQRRVNR